MPFVVVFYDVSDDRRRARLARVLEALGLVRVQRSVFIGRGGFSKAKEAARAARRIVDVGRDSVAVVVVPEDYARRVLVVGRLMGDPGEAGRVLVVV